MGLYQSLVLWARIFTLGRGVSSLIALVLGVTGFMRAFLSRHFLDNIFFTIYRPRHRPRARERERFFKKVTF